MLSNVQDLFETNDKVVDRDLILKGIINYDSFILYFDFPPIVLYFSVY